MEGDYVSGDFVRIGVGWYFLVFYFLYRIFLRYGIYGIGD